MRVIPDGFPQLLHESSVDGFGPGVTQEAEPYDPYADQVRINRAIYGSGSRLNAAAQKGSKPVESGRYKSLDMTEPMMATQGNF